MVKMEGRQASASASQELSYLGSSVSSDAFTMILRNRSPNVRNPIYLFSVFSQIIYSPAVFRWKSLLKMSASLTVLKRERDRSLCPLWAWREAMFSCPASGPVLAPGVTIAEAKWMGIPEIWETEWKLLSLRFSLIKPWRCLIFDNEGAHSLIIDITYNITRDNHFLQSRHITSLASRN